MSFQKVARHADDFCVSISDDANNRVQSTFALDHRHAYFYFLSLCDDGLSKGLGFGSSVSQQENFTRRYFIVLSESSLFVEGISLVVLRAFDVGAFGL